MNEQTLEVMQGVDRILASIERLLASVEALQGTNQQAWNLKDGAAILGLHYDSVRKEVRRRKLIPTDTFKLLTKEELLRYLREEVAIARRKVFGTRRANTMGKNSETP
jgi:hypothetical protein